MRKAIFTYAVAVVVGFMAASCSPDEQTGSGATPADSPKPEKEGVIDLVNHGGLDGFVPYFNPESPTSDLDEAWQIEEGMLRITGKALGYLRTKEEYENYRLAVEYKWGEFTDPSRDNRARDSGIFLHASSRDGEFRDSWLSSFEAQMVGGRAGDLIVIAALDRETGEKASHYLRAEVKEIEIAGQPSDFVQTPGAEARKLPPPRLERVRIFRDPHDYEWKDEKGYRSPDQIENPTGEWNRMVIVCDGDTIKIVLNEKTVNLARNVSPAKGHICIQSELSECWIRKLRLAPITDTKEE